MERNTWREIHGGKSEKHTKRYTQKKKKRERHKRIIEKELPRE